MSANSGSVTISGLGYVSSNQRIFADNYHPNADKLTTARTIALAGDVTGSTTFDGSANKTITVTVKDDSHNHTIASVDGLQTALDARAASSHNHDSCYYTEAEIDSKLAGKLSTSGKAADANKLEGKDSTAFADRAAYSRLVSVASGGELALYHISTPQNWRAMRQVSTLICTLPTLSKQLTSRDGRYAWNHTSLPV